MVGLATRHRRALSELQQAAKMWHARRVQSAERRGWVNPSDLSVGDHVSLPAFSDEHVRINEMLIRDGIADFYRRATEDPRTLSQVLELVQLTVETDGARLRIRDTHTSEICLDWTPGRLASLTTWASAILGSRLQAGMRNEGAHGGLRP
jgi:hypothetical protein